MFIDTHCHLDFEIYADTRNTILKECAENNIIEFINPATQYDRWDILIALNKQHPNINIAFGLHPAFIDKHHIDKISELEKYTQTHNTKLIGEIGLDKRFKNYDRQIDIFTKQVNIANNLHKPIIIHSVKSHNEIKIIKDSKFKHGGIIHAFNGNAEIARTYIELGFKLGIGGLLINPNTNLKNVLKKISIENILLETDSTDMKPYNSTDKYNTPVNIRHYFDILVDVYNINPVILKQQLYKNSIAFI